MKACISRTTLAAMVAAVAASATIPARAKTYGVRTETTSSNTTFWVARPDNTTEEIVHYRIVSRSALVGMHLTGTGNNTCNISFPAGFLTQKVSVSGLTADQINDPRFTYSLSGGSTGNSRTYRFEVVDEGGFVLAAAEGSIPYPSTNSVSSAAFATNSFSVVGSSGVTVTDANFTRPTTPSRSTPTSPPSRATTSWPPTRASA